MVGTEVNTAASQRSEGHEGQRTDPWTYYIVDHRRRRRCVLRKTGPVVETYAGILLAAPSTVAFAWTSLPQGKTQEQV